VEEPIIPNKTLKTTQFWQSNAGIVLSQASEANRQYVYLQTQLINNMLQQIAILLPKTDPKYASNSDQDIE
jgi:LPS-assembly lipoprotein